ncbi:MAG: hypothetical protein K6T65_08275 [Peptococcaceae bacterium]|nr:hypothetical protein [Peptococcaceae bacterium]
MSLEREYDMANIESMEEASQDYLRLFIDAVNPLEQAGKNVLTGSQR